MKPEINNKENWKIKKYIEMKQHDFKQPMINESKRKHKGNQKILKDKGKQINNIKA